jgi:hypothetical protein
MKDKFYSWKKLLFAIIITAVVFIAHYFSDFLEALVVKGLWYGWILLFVWYLIFLYFASALYIKFVGVN